MLTMQVPSISLFVEISGCFAFRCRGEFVPRFVQFIR